MLKSRISGERLREEGKPPTLKQNDALKQNKTKQTPRAYQWAHYNSKLPNSPCDASWLPHSGVSPPGKLSALSDSSPLALWWCDGALSSATLRRGQRPHLLAMPTSGAPATAASRPSPSRHTSSLLAGGGTRRNTGVRYWFKWKEFGQLISAVSPVWHWLAFHRLHLFNGGGRCVFLNSSLDRFYTRWLTVTNVFQSPYIFFCVCVTNNKYWAAREVWLAGWELWALQ